MTIPCCPKCESTSIGSKKKVFTSVHGVLVYCRECGSILAWGPEPS